MNFEVKNKFKPEIMALIDELIKEELALTKQLEVIRAVIQVYSGNYSGANLTTSICEPKTYFPTTASKEKQVLWIFENKVFKGIKLREVQETYNQLRGKDDVRIENTARRLKREGKLLIVKYNDQNTLSYWGLPNWVGENDFKDEFRPNTDSLPEIETSVIYRKE